MAGAGGRHGAFPAVSVNGSRAETARPDPAWPMVTPGQPQDDTPAAYGRHQENSVNRFGSILAALPQDGSLKGKD